MTLLERWDYSILYGSQPFTNDEIRRAIAIAQAVEEIKYDTKDWILRRADELLEGR